MENLIRDYVSKKDYRDLLKLNTKLEENAKWQKVKNNYILNTIDYFETVNGADKIDDGFEGQDNFIINEEYAWHLRENTDEVVYYIPDLDMFLLSQ